MKTEFDNADIFELEEILYEIRKSEPMGMTFGEAIERIEKIAYPKNLITSPLPK